MNRPGRALTLGMVVLCGLLAAPAPVDTPQPGDDATYRPTVFIRNGSGRGTGTLLASTRGQTLVLTAAHVVANLDQPVVVTLHRFNVGVETTATAAGFPKQFAATVAAHDRDADVAILRMTGLPALPFVAKLEPSRNLPEVGAVVHSLGYDHGGDLQGWSTRFRLSVGLRLPEARTDQTFLLTDDPPIPGRSGGGLFREDGTLVGVCVGRIGWTNNQTLGLFTPARHVHRLVDAHPDLAAALGRARGPIQARAR